MITPNSILINISPSLLKKAEPVSLWINMLGFVSVASIAFSTITLLGMIGWLIAKRPLFHQRNNNHHSGIWRLRIINYFWVFPTISWDRRVNDFIRFFSSPNFSNSTFCN